MSDATKTTPTVKTAPTKSSLSSNILGAFPTNLTFPLLVTVFALTILLFLFTIASVLFGVDLASLFF